MNNYHPNVNLTIDINPKRFFDIHTKNGKIETAVYRKSTKLPVPWLSNISKWYKRNAIIADLHPSKRISTNFDKENYQIKKKFLAADYAQNFVESVVRNFKNDKIESVKDDNIPPGFFNIAKPVIIVEVPFCTKNEFSSKHFMWKFHNFIGSKYDLWIKLITGKTKIIFKLKVNCLHPACKIYHSVCSCSETYREKLLEMWKPDGMNTIYHQKNQTPQNIWIAT